MNRAKDDNHPADPSPLQETAPHRFDFEAMDPEPARPAEPHQAPVQPPEPTERLDLPWQQVEAESAPDPDPAAARPEDADRRDDDRRRALRAAGVLAALAVLLVAAAFGAGRLVAGGADGAGAAAPEDEQGLPGFSESDPPQGRKPDQKQRPPYDGPVSVVGVESSSASCQSPDSVDEAGNPTSYPPAQAHDQDLSTAWRCDGGGVGQRLTLALPPGTTVAEVGLVPGYAKTDPASGVDRYAENNRITRVRWLFDDGTSVVQTMSSAPDDRSMRTMRVPATDSRTLVLEILESVPGARDTVAVSEVRVAAPLR